VDATATSVGTISSTVDVFVRPEALSIVEAIPTQQ
jgi:hypothetical protein